MFVCFPRKQILTFRANYLFPRRRFAEEDCKIYFLRKIQCIISLFVAFAQRVLKGEPYWYILLSYNVAFQYLLILRLNQTMKWERIIEPLRKTEEIQTHQRYLMPGIPSKCWSFQLRRRFTTHLAWRTII